MAQGAGLENRCEPTPANASKDNPHNSLDDNGCTHPNSVLASCLALLEREQPDLAAVVRAWPTLPEPIRAGLVALVRSAVGAK